MVGAFTWRDARTEWPQSIVTDRAVVTDPESLGLTFDAGDGPEARLVLWTGGWADSRPSSTTKSFWKRHCSAMSGPARLSLMHSPNGCWVRGFHASCTGGESIRQTTPTVPSSLASETALAECAGDLASRRRPARVYRIGGGAVDVRGFSMNSARWSGVHRTDEL